MIKITQDTYLNGLPTMGYSIHINGIKIVLKKDDFVELVDKLSETLKEDYQKVADIKQKYDKTVNKVREFKRDIIDIFWRGDQEDMNSMFYRRDIQEIDQKKLWETLEKYDRFLGLE
jgi:hypothetical protein